jgi:hypothetical protein
VPQLGLAEAEKRKKLRLLYHVSGEGLRQNALVVLSHGGYNIYGLGNSGGGGAQGETLGRQPLVAWLLRQPLWAGPNYSRRRWPDTPVTNTSTIL